MEERERMVFPIPSALATLAVVAHFDDQSV